MSTETQDIASLIEQLEGFRVHDGTIFYTGSQPSSISSYGLIRDGVAKLCLSPHTFYDDVPQTINNYIKLRQHLHKAGAKYIRDEKLEKAISDAHGELDRKSVV